MITETFFFDCQDVPLEMTARFDRPWNFVGEIDEKLPSLKCLCQKCCRRKIDHFDYEYIPLLKFREVQLTLCQFVTGDLLYVFVWFGWCTRCDEVYWARSGPPFERLRHCVSH